LGVAPAATRTESVDVAIIGGGIMGLATAYHLAKDGIDVMLLERGELNREASGTNAGNLHFQVTRLPDSSPERMAAARARVVLSEPAAAVWRTLESELDADLGLRVRGGLVVAETPDEVERLKLKAKIEHQAGVDSMVISGSEARQLAPELADDLLAADYLEFEGFGNPLLVTPAYARAAARHGARIHIHTEVLGLEHRNGGGFVITTVHGRIDAGRVLAAAGVWTGAVAGMLNVDLPVEGHVITVAVTEPAPFTLQQMVQHIGRKLTMKQTEYGTFVIGGGWNGDLMATTGLKRTRFTSTTGNLYAAARVVPGLGDVRLLRTWGGVSGAGRSYVPIIGEIPGVTGFYALLGGAGFTYGPLLGRLMAELLRSGRTTVPIGAFSPEIATLA
jgi:glycine/D-amino acid oxidase-like deaminating enzyme